MEEAYCKIIYSPGIFSQEKIVFIPGAVSLNMDNGVICEDVIKPYRKWTKDVNDGLLTLSEVRKTLEGIVVINFEDVNNINKEFELNESELFKGFDFNSKKELVQVQRALIGYSQTKKSNILEVWIEDYAKSLHQAYVDKSKVEEAGRGLMPVSICSHSDGKYAICWSSSCKGERDSAVVPENLIVLTADVK